MHTLEITKLTHTASGGLLDIDLQEDSEIQCTQIQVDPKTFGNLEEIAENFPDARYRILPDFRETENDEAIGEISLIHAHWIRRIPFHASPSFFHQINSIVGNKPKDVIVSGAERSGRYIPGLDGLRAIAVIAVIAFHLNAGFMPGGLLGVTLFFVLSGYLITDLLIDEYRRERRINLKAFWARRTRRLLPALYVMLLAVAIGASVLEYSQFTPIYGQLLATLLYMSNWWFIVHNISYFEQFTPTPLGHLWSLGIEEQFYIVWPFVVLAGLGFLRRRGALLTLTLVGALLSALVMAILYQPGLDPSRIYYGTDTRAFSLLIGAALALVWPRYNTFRQILTINRIRLDLAGGLGLAGIFLALWQMNKDVSALYYGGMVAVSVAAAVVIAATVQPQSIVGRILGWSPLRWLGKRSYGMYLWHYPVIVFARPVAAADGYTPMLNFFLQVAVCLILAALSWKYIEEPILRQGFIRFLKHCGIVGWSLRWYAARLSCALLIMIVFGVTVAAASLNENNIRATSDRNDGMALNANTGNSVPGIVAESRQDQTDVPSYPLSSTGKIDEPEPGPEPEYGRVTVVGDSIILGAEPYLKKLLPEIAVDGKIGRQMSGVSAVLENLQENNELSDPVVIELGTNGSFSDKQIDSIMKLLGSEHRIIFVNVRVPREWQDDVNETLARVSGKYANITLADWYAKSAGKEEYFSRDGVHLTAEGARCYSELIAETVLSVRANQHALRSS